MGKRLKNEEPERKKTKSVRERGGTTEREREKTIKDAEKREINKKKMYIYKKKTYIYYKEWEEQLITEGCLFFFLFFLFRK